MFGIEPDLLCADCADGVRRRLQVRFRPVARAHPPHVTIVCLAVSIALFVCTDVIWPARGSRPRPDWLWNLFQTSDIWSGEVWRHLSVVFLHGGWLHLGMNGMALWFLGRHVEAAWGPWALAGLMLFTGVCASAGEWMLQGGGVGLSGALFGLCGFLWALRRVHPTAAAIMNDQMIRWILVMLVLGVILSATGRLAVGNWAHGIGLVSGYVAGMAVAHKRRRVLVPLLGVLMVLLVAASTRFAFGSIDYGPGGKLSYPRSELRKQWLEQRRGR
jgi:membrane associated rhomboid family serine protease